jgi:hypothetical protein
LWRASGDLNPNPQRFEDDEGISKKVLNTKLKGKCQRARIRSKREKDKKTCHALGRILKNIQAEELWKERDS